MPERRAAFLHCILHGVARVEAEGYEVLAELGASPLRRVLTSGGSAAASPPADLAARLAIP